ALVVHEDTLTNGFAAEIIATINEQAFTFLDAPVRRITAPDIPVPYNINMMNAVIPNVTRIKEAIAGLLAY
ncbi:MAG: pyruvate dehydrogenase, partial [Anaerolineae bacterium]|nr:pyruvate dehydrogenase [Anaerolineae bacterium]